MKPRLSILLSVIIPLLMASCSENKETPQPEAQGVLLVNTGNFQGANGSISLYDEGDSTIANNAVRSANGGAEIAAGIEYLHIDENIGYIICNAPDKIEMIDVNSLKYVDNPITGLSTPRYMATYGQYAYVTCWGPWSQDFTLEESYVAVVDLDTREIVDSLSCGAGPEGIIEYNGRLYIANSYESTVTSYEISSDIYHTIDVGAAPQHLSADNNGNIWVSMGSFFGSYGSGKTGFAVINDEWQSYSDFINVENMGDEGIIAMNSAGSKIYFLTAQPWPGTATEVKVLDIETQLVNPNAVISGENFYGLGINPQSGHIYVSDAAGFQGNGRLLIHDTSGNLIDEQTTGVGPFHIKFVTN